MVVNPTVPRPARLEGTGEILDDRSKTGRQRPWKRNKENGLEMARAFRFIGEGKRADAIYSCGSWLKFLECLSGHARKLVNANFCRQRLCSMCMWRRALLTAYQVRLVAHTCLSEKPGIQFIFLTLTTPNVPADQFAAAISPLYEGFQRLWRTPNVKLCSLGYFRALEVTYNRKRRDYHPHLHVLIAVPPGYFTQWYLRQSDWLAAWRTAMRDSTITQVYVRKVRPKRGGVDELAGAAAEVGKYVVSPTDIIQKQLRDTAEVLSVIHRGLYNRRLIQFGGLFAEVKARLKLIDAERATTSDLVGVGDDPTCRCPVCRSELVHHIFRWLGGNYIG